MKIEDEIRTVIRIGNTISCLLGCTVVPRLYLGCT